MTTLSKSEINTQARNDLAIADLKSLGGIVAKGAWQTGTGNYKKARAIPVGASVYASYDKSAPASVMAWFKLHPRAEKCVALND